MLRSQGPLAALEAADLEWDPVTNLPRSSRFNDGYFGSADALGESRHVFIEGTDLQARIAATSTGCVTIAELGFGTGLNFLLSWETLTAHGAPNARLHYLSIERYPMRAAQLERALAPFAKAFGTRNTALVSAFPPPVAGLHRRSFDSGRIVLDLYFCDAEAALEELTSHGQRFVDAWYLDGFAPKRNTDMWTWDLYARMARCSRAGAGVATYSAAGDVRRGLEQAGFAVERRPGFGHKRECVRACLEREVAPRPVDITPWDLSESPESKPGETLILGAGLAGAHTAFALARRGVDVTVLEAGPIAGRASGNPQGLLFSRLSHVRSPLADFSLFAFLYAAQLYRELFEAGALDAKEDGMLDGCYQTPPPRGDFQSVLACLSDLPELGSAMTAAVAADHLGLAPAADGLWLEQSGWLSPPAVCRALFDASGIRVKENCGAVDLRREPGGVWRAADDRGARLAEAPVAINCLGSGSLSIGLIDALPLKVARGQTTQLPAPPGPRLARSFCHRGYLAPAVAGEHCIGATFTPGDDSRELRDSDHERNLKELALALPQWEDHLMSLDPGQLTGRADLRCVSPDYVPLIGPVPEAAVFRERFDGLRRDASRVINHHGAFLPGLYTHTALGSRGLSYAALGGEVLASRICGESPPLSRQLLRAVAPARFIVRDLIRNES